MPLGNHRFGVEGSVLMVGGRHIVRRAPAEQERARNAQRRRTSNEKPTLLLGGYTVAEQVNNGPTRKNFSQSKDFTT